MARKAHFRLVGNFDKARSATVTVEDHGGGLVFFRVRPYRRRRTYELLLTDVAKGVIFDVVRKELAEKRRSRKKSL
jgi:hypothetical protein